jgi:hypothetical protein
MHCTLHLIAVIVYHQVEACINIARFCLMSLDL